MSISNDELEQLEQLAAEVDAVEWSWGGVRRIGANGSMAYIAYANPERIGRLVAELRRLRLLYVVKSENATRNG